MQETNPKPSMEQQKNQRLINWAIFCLKGIHLILPSIRSIQLEIAYVNFKNAKNELLEALKKEHLK